MRDFRDNAAIPAVQIRLGGNNIGQDDPAVGDNRSSGFIAG
jgi:hypothetical protein